MLDPLGTTTELEHVYRRYLQTILNPRDPVLNAEFTALLQQTNNRLVRGPILQALAPYSRGNSIAELITERVLHPAMSDIPSTAFPVDRPLYRHQEQAIRQIVAGRNALVATATGSGKTESFLLPILDHLQHERDAGTLDAPGVRALLLYPMNALANDQLKRLREVLSQFPDVTFGQYIGDTQEDPAKARELFRAVLGGEPAANELISREEINTRPPHILITNFSMLEYLLLRPKDSSLFDGATGDRWKFIVLDEVHVYDGAKGTEIAFLLRRLRDRVVGSERGRLRCIGTSATLGSGPEDRPRLVEFAEKLFDEAFSEADLIEPVRDPLTGLESTWTASPEQSLALLEIANQYALKAVDPALFEAAGFPPPAQTDSWGSALGSILSTEDLLVRLRRALSNGAADLERLSSILDVDRDHLLRMVELGWRAVDSNENSLLPARYHTFIRSLEGAFVCAAPDHEGPRLSLSRGRFCESCLSSGRERLLFEFGTCRRCGSSYMIGELHTHDHGAKFTPADLKERDLVNLHWSLPSEVPLLSSLAPIPSEDLDEDEVADDDLESTSTEVSWLCTTCGLLREGSTPTDCCSDPQPVGVIRLITGKGGVSRTCVACTGKSKSNVVFRYLTGADAAGSVIASTLYQQLPEDPEPASDASAGGRKLLTFADSRQDAAFFAPYLDRTYSHSIQRRLLWLTLDEFRQENPTAEPQFKAVLDRLVINARQAGLFGVVPDPEKERSIASSWLMEEVFAVDSNQSLEGVGAGRIAPMIGWMKVPDPLIPTGFSERDVHELISALLSTLKIRHAVTLPPGVDIKDDVFAPRNFVTYLRSGTADGRVMAWSPSSGNSNARLDLVDRVFHRRGVAMPASLWLEQIWGWISSGDPGWDAIFPGEILQRDGVVRRLSHEHMAFRLADEQFRPTRCETCRSVTWYDLGGICSRYKCKGTSVPFDADDADHYFSLYTSIDVIPATIKEHTAQLDSREAARRQADFVRGKVNILSCSTTFELGVDVGEIQAVLLRNVPPSPANYVQRAGRAGRRAGSPALTVTFAKRTNHDQHYFANPFALINGEVKPPVLEVTNALIARRHIHSVAFSKFMRDWVSGGRPEVRSVSDFFEPVAPGEPSVCDEWQAWMESYPESLLGEIERILPPDVATALGVDGWDWVEALISPPRPDADEQGWLEIAKSDVLEKVSQLEQRIDELAAERAFQQANHVNGMLNTVRGDRLLNHLARKIVIPKYGFPVDTVQLDLSNVDSPESRQLELDRDLSLAIVEYAPGSEVVANKRLWRSDGVKVPAGLELIAFYWAECDNCDAVTTRLEGLEVITSCEVCGESDFRSQGTFLWPQFGFIGSMVGPAGEQRPRRIGSAEPHFGGYEFEVEPAEQEINGHVVRTISSRNGEIHLVNRAQGVGFRYCATCGRMEIPPERQVSKRKRGVGDWKHDRPGTSRRCNSVTWKSFALGHKYHTDVAEIRLGIGGGFDEYLSALQAILAALPEIGIHRADVRGMLRRHSTAEPHSLLLVDSVPGGAGHSKRIVADLPSLLEAAAVKVQECDCAEDSSCYACLRSYENQRNHDRLRRDSAAVILRPFTSW